MKSNYNNIVDIILTLLENKDLSENMIISGSIVPYLIMEKQSEKKYDDTVIYIREKKISDIRKIIKKLHKEYDFEISSDSLDYNSLDFGFKIEYEGVLVRFYPYTLSNNIFTMKSYSLNMENKLIKYKTKKIANITKNLIMGVTKFGNKKIRIISPEILLATLEQKEKKDSKLLSILDKLSDESVLKIVRQDVNKMKVDSFTKEFNKLKSFISILK